MTRDPARAGGLAYARPTGGRRGTARTGGYSISRESSRRAGPRAAGSRRASAAVQWAQGRVPMARLQRGEERPVRQPGRTAPAHRAKACSSAWRGRRVCFRGNAPRSERRSRSFRNAARKSSVESAAPARRVERRRSRGDPPRARISGEIRSGLPAKAERPAVGRVASSGRRSGRTCQIARRRAAPSPGTVRLRPEVSDSEAAGERGRVKEHAGRARRHARVIRGRGHDEAPTARRAPASARRLDLPLGGGHVAQLEVLGDHAFGGELPADAGGALDHLLDPAGGQSPFVAVVEERDATCSSSTS